MHSYTKFILKVTGCLYLILLVQHNYSKIADWLDPAASNQALSLVEPAGELLSYFVLLVFEILIARWLIREIYPDALNNMEIKIDRLRDIKVPNFIHQLLFGCGVAGAVLLPIEAVREASRQLPLDNPAPPETVFPILGIGLIVYAYYKVYRYPRKMDKKAAKATTT